MGQIQIAPSHFVLNSSYLCHALQRFLKVCFICNPLFPGVTTDCISVYIYLIISVGFQTMEANTRVQDV